MGQRENELEACGVWMIEEMRHGHNIPVRSKLVSHVEVSFRDFAHQTYTVN